MSTYILTPRPLSRDSLFTASESPRVTRYPCDGMISASQVVSCFAERRDIFEKALSYFRYPHVLENVRFESREEAEKASRNEAFIAERALIESEIEGEGRVFLRSSGTEPLFRIYVECRTEEKARSYADRLEKALRRI